MIITGKMVGKAVGILSIVATIIMLIGNILFEKGYSNITIGLGCISSAMLLLLSSNKNEVRK